MSMPKYTVHFVFIKSERIHIPEYPRGTIRPTLHHQKNFECVSNCFWRPLKWGKILP